MKLVPEWLVNRVLAPYRSRFVYPQSDQIVFDLETNSISGSVAYLCGPYLKKKSSVFNAPEASFAFFQLMYILTTCYMMLKDGCDPFAETMPRVFRRYYDLQGRLVVRKLNLLFELPIYGSPKDVLPATLSLTHSGKSRQHFPKYEISGNLGQNAEFQTKMSIYLIDRDIHGVKVSI